MRRYSFGSPSATSVAERIRFPALHPSEGRVPVSHRTLPPGLVGLASRGVYYLPWLGTHGEIYLAAVDRNGRRIYEATVYAGQDAQAAERALWDLLDQEDPLPPIRLVS